MQGSSPELPASLDATLLFKVHIRVGVTDYCGPVMVKFTPRLVYNLQLTLK